jgi:hypothetical protein
LFYAHPTIQPWVYPEALRAFHLLLGGEGRDEGGLKTIIPPSLCVAAIFLKLRQAFKKILKQPLAPPSQSASGSLQEDQTYLFCMGRH